MKTKFFVVFAAFLFAAITAYNLQLAQIQNLGVISLADITVMAQADGESANWVYFAKLTAEPIYDDYVTTTCGVTGWFKLLGGSFEIETTHHSGLAGEIKNCTFWLTARCDQNEVGVFYN